MQGFEKDTRKEKSSVLHRSKGNPDASYTGKYREHSMKSLCFALVIAISGAAFAQDSLATATVRPAASGADGSYCRGGPDTADPGNLKCRDAPLMLLICLAYQVQYYQVSGPHWLEEDGYDIDASVPARVTRAQFLLMFQNLLHSRFRLSLHRGSKEGTVHALVLAKGGTKMQRNEAGASSFDVTTKEESVIVTGKRQPVSALVGFLSLKMGVSGPVLDETGLPGEYNFTLEYTPAEIFTGARYKISLFDALETQLGLKLENKRGPIDTLQVDYAEKQ
jgi:uncharacterized protein (TIGR03435 family)